MDPNQYRDISTFGTRGSRTWRGRGSRRFSTSQMPTSISQAAPLGAILDSVNLSSLQDETSLDGAFDAKIRNCSLVASYNLMENPTGSIAIPGLPPKWTPLSGRSVRRLKEDSGTYYRDINAAYSPKGPFEPAIGALMAARPDVREIDIFGCGGTLGNLLRFCSGANDKVFRILVHVVGNVVHLVRRESSPTETLQDVRGYGHSFPEAYTTWDWNVKGSASHQRIIRYTFSGLNILVRSEGDGYLPDKAGEMSKSAQSQVASGVGELVASLKMVGTAADLSANSSNEVKLTGSVIPQAAIFDLKTRSIKRKGEEELILDGELPRLWIRQIPNFILAYHRSGSFEEINVKDVRKDVDTWEESNQDRLRRFSRLLKRIVEMAKIAPDGKLEITSDGSSKLCIREQLPDAPATCSRSTEKKWESWLEERYASEGIQDAAEKHDGDEEANEGRDAGVSLLETDRVSDEDFTACDDECGYCGSCAY